MDSAKEHVIAALAVVAQGLRELRKIWRGREPATEGKIDTIISEAAGLVNELASSVEAPLEPLIASEVMAVAEDIDEAADAAKDRHLADALRVQSGTLKQTLFTVGIEVGNDGRLVFTDRGDKAR